jgi:iron complex outermembrane receptor protein
MHRPRSSLARFDLAPLALAVALSLGAFAVQAQTTAAAPVDIAITAQPLAQALTELARQAKLTLMVPPALVAGRTAPAVSGRLTPQQALDRLLAGSGLVATQEGNAVVVRAAPATTGANTLPAVTVMASTEPESATGPLNGYVAKRSATATKTDTPLLEVPQSISVIGRNEMEARGALDVMDIVRYTPGIATNSYGPDNRGWEDMLLRGFTTTNGIFRDGLAQPAFGPTGYLTEPYALERVEVLRGPSSMVFGQGEAGGIINRVSKQPSGERTREIEVQYGSYQRKQLAFDLGDQIGGTDLSYRLLGVSMDSNDQDRYPDGRKLNRTRTFIAPSVRWQPNATTSLTVFAEFLKNSTGEDPYYFSQNRVLTSVKMGDYSFGQLKQTQSVVGYRFETALNDSWTLRQNFRYGQIEHHRRAVWVDALGEDQRTISRVARTWNDPANLATLDTNVQGKLQYGSVQHTVLLGIDFLSQKGKQRRFIGPAPDLDVLAPLYGQPVTMPTEPLSDFAQSTRQTGFYAQDQIKFGDSWVVTLGARHDQVRQITNDYLNTSHSRQSDSAFSSRAGLTYLLGNGWAPYVSYSESFLPNSGVDGNSEPFKPSRGKQVEVGVKYQPEGTRTSFTAAVFDLRKTNVVTYDPVTFEGRQIGKQRSRGLELEAKGELAPGLNIAASYTWLDMKVLNSADPDELGKIPPLVPKQSASVWLDYTLGNGLGFGGGVRYIGKRQNDEHNTSLRTWRDRLPTRPCTTRPARGALRSTSPTSSTRSTSRSAITASATSGTNAR